MQLIMENWREYKNRQYLLEDPVYVTATLGIQIPLNESYPYSSTLTEEILREQLLLEAFWDPVVAWGKAKAGSTKEKVKNLAKKADTWGQDLADTMHMLYKAFFEGKVAIYNAGLQEELIDPLKTPILEFLDLLIERGPKWNMPTFSAWAKKTKEMVVDELNKASSAAQRGWKGSLSLTVVGLGLVYLWKKAGSAIREILKLAADIRARHTAKLVEPIKKKITDLVNGVLANLVKNTLKEVFKAASAVFGNVLAWVNKLKQIFGGLTFVIGGLSFVQEYFGHEVEHEEDPYMMDLPDIDQDAYADNELERLTQARMAAKQQKAT